MTDKPTIKIEVDCTPTGERKALGGSNHDQWNDRLSTLVTRALPVNQKNIDAVSLAGSAAAAGIVDLDPADPIEGILISEIVVANEAAMHLYRLGWLNCTEYFEAGTKYLQLANKASRTVAILTERLDQHRNRGQQQIVVKHVTVNADQAVVADAVVTGKPAGNIPPSPALLTVRITCQLVDAATGAHLWAERYDRSLDDVFALQDEITLAVVAAIEPNLRAAEIEQVKRKRPESLDAYDLVLRALPEVYTCMPPGAATGLTFLERALVFEPNYALAHGLASWAHEILFVRSGMKEENRRGAIDHAHAAIAYGRSDAMALTFGAFSVAMVEHDRKMAFDAFEEAVALCPSCAPAYIFASAPLSYAAQAEQAIDWGERAMRLSPFDPLAFVAYHGICVGNFHLGRYEEAANAARKAIQSNPGFSFSYALLAAPLAKLGLLEEARAAVRTQLCVLQPNFSINRQCAAVGIIPVVAEPLIEALRAAGLPD